MDGWDTWSNWNEAGGTKRCDDRKETVKKAGELGLKESTAQGNLLKPQSADYKMCLWDQ